VTLLFFCISYRSTLSLALLVRIWLAFLNMQHVWCKRGLAGAIIGQLTLHDAMQVVMSCRQSAGVALPFKAAIAFGVSRQCVCSGLSLSLRKWKSLWEACAQSVALYGMDPSLWAYAEHISVIIRDSSDEDRRLRRLPEKPRFLKSLLVSARDGDQGVELRALPCDSPSYDIMVILMIYASFNGYGPKNIESMLSSGHALAVLSDDRFALAIWDWCQMDNPICAGGAVVYIAETLPALLDLVSSATNEVCCWETGDHGFLKLRVPCTQYLRQGGMYLDPCLLALGNCWGSDSFDRVEKLSDIMKACWKGTVPDSSGDMQQANRFPEPTMAPVIQSCSHDEPPAARDAQLLQEQEDSEWAAYIENRIHSPVANFSKLPGSVRDDDSAAHESSELAQPSDKVHLVSFRSGQGEQFREMLLQGKEFRQLRNALEEEGCPYELQSSGTLVLVRPDQYMQTLRALKPLSLKRYQVVIAESEEYLMEEVLQHFASRQRPRENKAVRLELDLQTFDANFIVERTFLCTAPSLLFADTVTQSTTEAVQANSGAISSDGYFDHFRGQNPRRHVLDSMW